MEDEMTDDNAGSFTLGDDSTWREALAEFEKAATWLTPADAPQLMALRAIAKELDTGKFQAALISQFTLVHRALLVRRPGGNATPTGDPDDLGLFGLLGGAAGDAWKA